MKTGNERCFHECPNCGLLTPYLQSRCDCGYRFATKKPTKSSRNLNAVCVILLIASVFLNAFLLLCRLPSGKSVSANSTPAEPSASDVKPPSEYAQETPLLPQYNYIPVPISNGQMIKEPPGEALAPLTVDTQAGKNYYIYLEPCLNPGILLSSMSFYIEGGKSADVLVPLGNYKLYYATGSVWYGESILFGEETACYECDDLFQFYEEEQSYMGWTVKLYPQTSGNLDTDPIPIDEFPGFRSSE